MKKMFGILCVLLFAVSLSVSASDEQINMVRNSGFENGLALWNYNGDAASVDSTVSREGEQSLKLESSTERTYCNTNFIPVNPAKTYTFSVYVKTQDVEANGGVYMKIQRFKEDGTTISMRDLMSAQGTQEWTKYSCDFSALLSEETAYVKIYCYIAADAGGTAWIDDISLVQEKSLVKNSSFEYALSSADWVKTSGTHEIDTNIAYSGERSVKFTSAETQSYYYTAEIDVDSNKEYILSARIKTDGVTATDGAKIRFQVYNSSSGNWSMLTGNLISTSGTQDWTKYTYEYTPANTITKVRVYIYLAANAGGYAWYDDVELVEKNIDNYVSNPGFEEATGTSNWAKLTDNAAVDSETSNSGECSLKISGAETSQYIMSNLIPVDIAKKYRLSAYIKTQDISTNDGAYIRLQYLDENKTNISPMRTFITTGGTQGWKKYTVNISEFNENTAYIRVYFYVGAGVTGDAWIDDVSLKEYNLITISADASTWTNGNVTCNVTASETEADSVIVGAVYQNQQMVDVKLKNYSCIYEGIETFSLPLNLPGDGQSYTVKIMLWKDLLNITPMCESFDYTSSAQ